MRVVDIIEKKKNGFAMTKEEIDYIISGYVNEQIPDYQISALLMAVCLKGLTKEERFYLTDAMLHSGEVVDLTPVPGIHVDKHSTGGVGDKTTLVVAPLVASCGLRLAKMSGRGLGHTGGTLDKLTSIPGFNVDISSSDFIKQVREIGLAVVGQTKNIAPADKKLYALRDVTGTVESIGLISSSIMAKKLASGADSIVLDVKVGSGAFMKTLDDARALAQAMVDLGRDFKKRVVAVLSDMSEPLGECIGNSLEVEEAIEVLKGRGLASFREFCLDLTAYLLLAANAMPDIASGKALARKMLDEGKALSKFKEMIKYQGGDVRVIDDYTLLPSAKKKTAVTAPKDCYIKAVDALEIGKCAMLLGAGRNKKDDLIDYGVGIRLLKKTGAKVKKGDILAYVYSNGKCEDFVCKKVLESYEFTLKPVVPGPIILDIVK